jgi:hypothetical protein
MNCSAITAAYYPTRAYFIQSSHSHTVIGVLIFLLQGEQAFARFLSRVLRSEFGTNEHQQSESHRRERVTPEQCKHDLMIEAIAHTQYNIHFLV